MEKKLHLPLLFILCCLLPSCSKNKDIPDEPEIKKSSFEISVVPVSEIYEIDRPIEFKVTANQGMKALGITRYTISNGDTVPHIRTAVSLDTVDLTKEGRIFTSFDSLGKQTIKIHAENKDLESAEKELNIDIQKGDAVKLTFVRVASFYQKSEMWDPQGPGTSPYLSAFYSVLFKDGYSTAINESSEKDLSRWFQPANKIRGEKLFWDLSDKNFYINTSSRFTFEISGEDDKGFFMPLRENYPYSRYNENFSLEDYIDSKPDSIKITGDGGNLQVILGLEW